MTVLLSTNYIYIMVPSYLQVKYNVSIVYFAYILIIIYIKNRVINIKDTGIRWILY